MVTRPKLIAPLQIGLATATALPASPVPDHHEPLRTRCTSPGSSGLPRERAGYHLVAPPSAMVEGADSWLTCRGCLDPCRRRGTGSVWVLAVARTATCSFTRAPSAARPVSSASPE